MIVLEIHEGVASALSNRKDRKGRKENAGNSCRKIAGPLAMMRQGREKAKFSSLRPAMLDYDAAGKTKG